jgi:hypothetical protein
MRVLGGMALACVIGVALGAVIMVPVSLLLDAVGASSTSQSLIGVLVGYVTTLAALLVIDPFA